MRCLLTMTPLAFMLFLLCPTGSFGQSVCGGLSCGPDGSAISLSSSQAVTKGDLDQTASRSGLSYIASTGAISIPASNYLNVVFTCGAPTGSYCILFLRKFGNSSTSVLEYQNFKGSTAPSGGTVKTAVNKSNSTAALTTSSSITYATGTALLSTGTALNTDFVYASSETLATPVFILKPGDTFGISISGISGALASAASVSVTFVDDEITL